MTSIRFSNNALQRCAPVKALELNPDGSTGDPLWIWSGDTLMNPRKNEALSMRMETRNNTDYLFIETGGFQTKNGKQRKSPWFVMQRL